MCINIDATYQSADADDAEKGDEHGHGHTRGNIGHP